MFYCNFETFEFHSDFLVFYTRPCRSSFYLIYYALFLSGSPVIFIQNSFIRWFVVRYATRCPVKLQLQLISVAFGFSITDLCHKMPCKTAISAHICGIWFFHYRPLPQDALQNCNFSSYLWHLVWEDLPGCFAGTALFARA